MSDQESPTPICNRKVCNEEASWWNPSTRAYYCGFCAQQINKAAKRFDGVEQLCVEDPKHERQNDS